MTSVDITRAPSDTQTPANRALRIGAVTAVVSLVANLLVLVVGRLAGADMAVVQTGTGKEMTIGAGPVAVMTLLPIALGTVALLVARRWGLRGWTTLAWVGLALGVLTVFMPFTVGASTVTAVTLAVMHVVTGVAWFVVVRRAVATQA